MDHTWRLPKKRYWASVLVAATVACSTTQPVTITETDTQAVRDTVTKLENAMNLAVDALDCEAGMTPVGDQEPIFVSGGRVTRNRAAMRDVCETIVAPRTGAVFVVDSLTCHVLSPDAASVVREGVYTVNFKGRHFKKNVPRDDHRVGAGER